MFRTTSRQGVITELFLCCALSYCGVFLEKAAISDATANAQRSRRGLEGSGRLLRSVAVVSGGVAGPTERKESFQGEGTSPPKQGHEKAGAWAAYGGGEIELEGLQWSEHQANPGDGMALQGRRELRQVGGAFVLLHRPVADRGGVVGRGSPFSSGPFSPRGLPLSRQPATLPAAEGMRALVLTGESSTVCTRVCSPSLAPLLFQWSQPNQTSGRKRLPTAPVARRQRTGQK
ncbi:uncharacterized protein LOC111731836 isoform X2 [Pteropus vampyrus]|uniref:Uncharacterized protein LOC111731836 isoform X2 n=1 Tax=Pteropus vampyrus TaxID=132908 RepID=A0A6P6BWG1_PTEVA|nr:uncharacterized protein LOC111731836 isoform X2 [Pteropus vampyrus]